MQIKIFDDASKRYVRRRMTRYSPMINWDWQKKLQLIDGKILDVETEFLFQDQFNTAPIEGISELGLRIMAESVEYVMGDERHGKMRCQWCGKTNEQAKVCPDCGKSEYIKWFYVFDERVPATQMINPR